MERERLPDHVGQPVVRLGGERQRRAGHLETAGGGDGGVLDVRGWGVRGAQNGREHGKPGGCNPAEQWQGWNYRHDRRKREILQATGMPFGVV